MGSGRPDAAERVADLLEGAPPLPRGPRGARRSPERSRDFGCAAGARWWDVFRKIQHVHFVGIGGSGMSGIAEVLLNLGYAVSGSDLAALAPSPSGWWRWAPASRRATRPRTWRAPTWSSPRRAVRGDNPEVLEARRRRFPVIPRAEMLAELMRLKYGVAVAGSHGKTTTTSMVAQVLDRGGLDPTVIVGGIAPAPRLGRRVGEGEFMVAEADESDGSFLKLTPTIAVVTNIDREHLDPYATWTIVQEAFLGFLNKVPFYGAAIVCLDDGPTRDIVPRVERRVLTYGLSPQADVSARDVQSRRRRARATRLALDGAPLGPVALAVPGAHNVVNSLAAVAVGLDLGVPFAEGRGGLESFAGVDRRFQLRGEAGGVMVIDDYGHHPTEIRATLETLRGRAGRRRTVVLFQPHRYTRTRLLWDEFCHAFHLADVLLVTDIYPASEPPGARRDAEALAAAIAERGHRKVSYVGDMATAAQSLARGGPGRRRGADARRGQCRAGGRGAAEAVEGGSAVRMRAGLPLPPRGGEGRGEGGLRSPYPSPYPSPRSAGRGELPTWIRG